MKHVSLLFAVSIIFVIGTCKCSFSQCSTLTDTEGGVYEDSDGEVRCSGFGVVLTNLKPHPLPKPKINVLQDETLITSLANPVIYDIWDPLPEQQILSQRKFKKKQDLLIIQDAILRRRA